MTVHHFSQMHPFDKCDRFLVTVLTVKCVLAEVEEYNPHISSVVFIYNSSCADQTATLTKTEYFPLSVSESADGHSPPTSMKCLAANPDLGAEEREFFFIIMNTAKLAKLKLQHCQEPLTHSPIASMWNCYLDVCLHNGLIKRANIIIISTVSNKINVNVTYSQPYIWLVQNGSL